MIVRPHLDLADREQFRIALAATLIKRPEDGQAFEVLFDICFPLTSASASPLRTTVTRWNASRCQAVDSPGARRNRRTRVVPR